MSANLGSRSASGPGSASRRRKLLLVVPNPDFYLSHRRSLASSAEARGWAVVATTDRGPANDEIRALGMRQRIVPRLLGGTPLDMWRAARVLRQVVEEERPELIHLVSVRAILAGGLALRRSACPVLHHLTGLGFIHADGRPSLRWAVEQAYARALRRRHSWALFQNPDDRDELCRRGIAVPERSRVVLGSGVDLGRFQVTEMPRGDFTILFASRALRMKGLVELVTACRRLREAGRSLRLVVAGVPDLRNPSSLNEAELRAWHQSGDIEWRGQAQQVERLLADCHVAALPSYGEGLPRFLAEAAACGRPVITTDVPGCREAVQHGVTGLLVAARSVAALADAIACLDDDRALHARLAQAARPFAEQHFDVRKIDAEVLDLYDELLGEGGPDAP